MADYRLDDVVTVIGGIPLSEYEKGDAISIALDNDEVELSEGTNGAVAANHKRVSTGKATVRIFGTSPVNDVLQGLLTLQRAAIRLGASPPRMTFFCRDTRGRKTYSAEHSYIMKSPDATFGETVSPVEWGFALVRPEMISGGNSEVI